MPSFLTRTFKLLLDVNVTTHPYKQYLKYPFKLMPMARPIMLALQGKLETLEYSTFA